MKTTALQARPTLTPISNTLQRKCACGQHTTAGECANCRRQRESALQRKAVGSAAVNEVPPVVHDVLCSPGQPLDAATRAWMEPRFGHDCSNVRVHQNERAAQSAQAISARAYTFGKDIVFNTAEFQPHTGPGKRLLAHELTHSIQQEPVGRQAATLSINTDRRLEAEAERAAATTSAHAVASNVTRQNRSAIQRDAGGVTVRSPALEETLTQLADFGAANSGRPLTRPERELAQPVFGSSLDYARVRLIPTPIFKYTTVANNIQVPQDFTINDAYMAQTLIHELTHVWQYQHLGTAYISISLGTQIAAALNKGNRGFAYGYTIQAGNTFFDFTPEQQASIVENYFKMLGDQSRITRAPAGSPAQVYDSNHLGADGFPAPLSAAGRRAEISSELPLHEPLVTQMRNAVPRPEIDLMKQRAMDVMSMPGEALTQTPRERQTIPVKPLLEIRF